jgi:hypothetical protein
VGKAAGREAFGGVPTIRREDIRLKKMVGTAQMRLCPPYGLIIRDPNGGTLVMGLFRRRSSATPWLMAP